MGETLHVLLKYQTDITKARKELGVDAPGHAAQRAVVQRCSAVAEARPRAARSEPR